MAIDLTQPQTQFDSLFNDDGVERWVLKGVLREKSSEPGEPPMTVRNRFHSSIMAAIAGALRVWRRDLPSPKGEVLCGEAGFRLPGEPVTIVGVDVAYVAADVLARQSGDSTLVEGVPQLAVEILSPSDTIEETEEKIDAYLDAGVPMVWVINPHRRTATIYRPGEAVRTINEREVLDGHDVLKGFRIELKDLFE